MPVMILGVYDEKRNKNIYTAEEVKEACMPTPMFLSLLREGYKLKKVHSYHKYRIRDSLFRPLVMKLFIKKTVNSGPRPENFDELVELYRKNFDDEFADELADSGEWTLNPAMKHVYKILLNSGWGKHAQRPRLTKNIVYDEANADHHKELNLLYSNCEKGKQTVTGIENVAKGVRSFNYENSDLTDPDLHDTYLAAAAYVPLFGQLQLWEIMNKIEKGGDGSRRIVYCDTDSIIYKWYPEEFGYYNVPENEALLGGWTVEGKDIVEVVALQPKTYCYKFANGTCSPVKTKGIRMGYRLSDIVNFDIMKQKVLRQMELIAEGDGKKVGKLSVPQESFAQVKNNIVNHKHIKKFGIDIDDMKGVMLANGDLMPFGYDEAPEQEMVLSSWAGYRF